MDAKEIFFDTNIEFCGASDPRAVGAMLFARNFSNMGAIILLVENGMLTEARIVLRSSVENFIWLSAVLTKGDDFVKDMLSDDVKGRRGLYKVILDKIDGVDSEAVKRLEDAKIFWDTHWPKPSMLTPSDAAEKSPIGSIYLLYKQLCLTVSHPTPTALCRHLVSDEHEGDGIDLSPAINPAERLNTIFEACLVMLGVVVAFGQLTETRSGNLINALAEEYERLRTQTGVH